MTGEHQWQRVQEAIRGSISTENYMNWVEPVQFRRIDDDRRLHLVAPNADVRDWLKIQFAGRIVTEARTLGMDVGGVHIDIGQPAPQPIQQTFNFAPEQPQLNANYTFDRFVVGSCNEFAHSASQAVATQPARIHNPLYVYSGVGMGKTHLLHAIGHHLHVRDASMKVVYTSAEEFMNEMIKSISYNNMRKFRERFRRADALLVDDVQAIGSKQGTQEEFFNTFNALHNDGKQIVICSDSDPETIPGLVGRLRSRFSWGLMVDIQPPDLETKMAILDRRAADAGVELPADARSYIATRLHSNIRELEGVLNRLIARAQFVGCKITLGMVKNMFGAQPLRAPGAPTAAAIQHAVAAKFGVTTAKLVARNNARSASQPRQIAMYLCKQIGRLSYTEIAKTFERHHTTVLHAINKVEKHIKVDQDLKSSVNEIIRQLSP